MKHKIDWKKIWKTFQRWTDRLEKHRKPFPSWEEQRERIQMLVEKELIGKAK